MSNLLPCGFETISLLVLRIGLDTASPIFVGFKIESGAVGADAAAAILLAIF